MVEKLRGLRIFADDAGKMNRSLTETGGGILLVSQFTLLGNTKSGRRPGFEDAAPPDEARHWYERVSKELKVQGTQVEIGRVCRPHEGRVGERRPRHLCVRQSERLLSGLRIRLCYNRSDCL